MSIVATILALNSLLDHSHQQLVAEVTLGGLGVGVQDEGVRDLESVGHLHLHPGWSPVNIGGRLVPGSWTDGALACWWYQEIARSQGNS